MGYYNYERPHMALGYSTPAEVYYKEVKPKEPVEMGLTHCVLPEAHEALEH